MRIFKKTKKISMDAEHGDEKGGHNLINSLFVNTALPVTGGDTAKPLHRQQLPTM